MGKIYTTWNPDDKHSEIILSNNNLTALGNTLSVPCVRSILSHNSGRHYFECLVDIAGYMDIGLYDDNPILRIAESQTNYFVYRVNIGRYFLGGGSYSTGHPTLTAGDICNVAFDLDNNFIWFGKNGVWNDGDPATGLNPSITLNSGITYFALLGVNLGIQGTANFGATPFIYTVPSGFNSGFYLDTDIYVLSGSVKNGAIGLQRTVRVEKHSDRSLVGEKISDINGEFLFDSITYPLITDSDTYDIFAYGDDTAELGQILAFGNVSPIVT